MKRVEICTIVFAGAVNFALFLLKLYVGISSGSLTVYCDSINNLGDAAGCLAAAVGFLLMARFDEKRGARIQALCSFVIGIFVFAGGVYFIYNGAERLLYPTQVAYAQKYAVLIGATAVIKLAMGLCYVLINKRRQSAVFKVFILDSFLDCAVTLTALAGFVLVGRVQFAADGVFAIIIGAAITASALKTLWAQARALVNG
ncbi:MAG: cation transporter [Clostridiales bacterium]|nr:cation transporter [Clostridiales bacterium]